MDEGERGSAGGAGVIPGRPTARAARLPLVALALLGAVGGLLLLVAARPGPWVVVAILVLLFVPGRWWRWRIRHFRRGVRHLRRGEPAEAREDLERFVAEMDDRFERLQPIFNLGRPYPYAAAALANLGLASLALGETDRALERFDAALSREPRWAPALYGRAGILRRRGDLAGAEEAALAALAARPGYLPARLLLALVRGERGDDEGSESLLRPLGEEGRDPQALLARLRATWEPARPS